MVISQVKIPVFDDSTLTILIPLLLSTENTSILDGNPLGGIVTSTRLIADPLIIGVKRPLSISLRVSKSITVKDGAVVYPSPELVTETTPTSFEFDNIILGDIAASGLRVGSEGYR